LPDHEVRPHQRALEAMIDSPAALGPRHWRGLRARRHCERWVAEATRDAGDGDRPIDLLVRQIAPVSEADRRVAAVEVINLLRPIVAVARYITFAAAHLVVSRSRREDLADAQWRHAFVQEVRRTAPFFPMVAARARGDDVWNGEQIRRGQFVFLDLYATNHHPDSWAEPELFDPARHIDRAADPFELIPQGGGDHWTGHRCAGEWLTIALMDQAIRHLVQTIEYDVPLQDLSVRLNRIPTAPHDGVRIRQVHRVAPPV
jgi:fatty-acid peroxygenase